MYCQNCGSLISDGAKFCSNCGGKVNGLTTEEKRKTPQTSNDIDREALLIYLSDVRFLEVAKIKLQDKLNSINKRQDELNSCIEQINKNIRDIKSESYYRKRSLKRGILGIIISVIALEGLGYWNRYMLFCFIILLLGGAITALLLHLLSTEGKRNSNKVDKEKILIAEKETTKNHNNKYIKKIKIQRNKLDYLITNAYSINIIPAKFRNIYAVYFLYDYMSTSSESFSSALLHCDLDKIQGQLKNVIDGQSQIIINQHRQMAQNAQMIEQNRSKLRHLKNISATNALMTKYTLIENNNIEACGWFNDVGYMI